MRMFKIISVFLTALTVYSCGINSFNKYNSSNEKTKKWIEVEPNEDSILYIISTYKNNVRNGDAQIFYANDIVAKGKYTNGLQQGKWSFYKKGVLFKRAFYKEGINTEIEEIENGKVIKRIIVSPSF